MQECLIAFLTEKNLPHANMTLADLDEDTRRKFVRFYRRAARSANAGTASSEQMHHEADDGSEKQEEASTERLSHGPGSPSGNNRWSLWYLRQKQTMNNLYLLNRSCAQRCMLAQKIEAYKFGKCC